MRKSNLQGMEPFPRCMTIMLCALLILLSISVSGTIADAEPRTVRVGYYENEVFQEGAQEGAVKTGYAYEYYRKLSEYTGWKYQYVYGDFSQVYQMLLNGEVDLMAGLAWREDRASIIGYPDDIMGNESYFLVRHDTDTHITADPEGLNGCRIGVLDSAIVSVLEKYLSERHIHAEVIRYPTHEQLAAAFDTHEVDVITAEGDGASGKAHVEVLTAFGTSGYYLCVNINRPDLLAELNTAQTQLATEEPNYLKSLSSKYYSRSVITRAFSQAERDWMNAHKELHIGYLENYLPYSETDADGNVTGILKDMIPELLRSLGISDLVVTYKGYQSYDEMIAAMSTGDIDAAFPVGGGLYYSEENGIYQSSPVVSVPTALIYAGEFSERTTARVAVNENNRMQYYHVRANYPDAEIVFYPSIEDCLTAVVSGQAGCTTLNGLRVSALLKNRRFSSLSFQQSSYSDDRAFGVEIGNEGLLKLLNRGINVLGSEYAQSISSQYAEKLSSYTVVDMILDHIAVVGTAVLAVAAVIIFLLVRGMQRTKKEIREKEQARRKLEEKNLELAESQTALTEALAAAKRANSAKTTFLNNMSHDIRTPMNAIVGFTALASSHIDNRDQVQDYLEKITVSSQHLLSLINNVLDMSRIESGKMTIENAEVHLPDMIRDMRTIIQANVAAKQLELVIDTRDIKHEDIITDKLRLNQVLLNILTNAIKFTPPGGTIGFQVIEKPSPDQGAAHFEFRVKDNGIGMSEEFQKTIFEAFTRERTSTVSGIQGTGLGMAITKNIVDMMGGTITLQSTEGKGTEFVVNLPFQISTIPAKPQDSQPEPDVQAEKPDFSGKRVLLAEDNEMNQMIAMAILTELGLEVDIVGDGTDAVEKMKTVPAGTYDIILMDIQMPIMDGYRAAKQIRNLKDPAKANIPIVAVTANAFEADRQTALQAGMNGHLAKPYDIPAIIKTLKQLLK